MKLTFCGTEFCGLKFIEPSTKKGNPTVFWKIKWIFTYQDISATTTASDTQLPSQSPEQPKGRAQFCFTNPHRALISADHCAGSQGDSGEWQDPHSRAPLLLRRSVRKVSKIFERCFNHMHYTYLQQLLPDEKMRKSPLRLRDTHWKKKASLLVQISHRLNKEQKRDTQLSDFTTLHTGSKAMVGDQNYFLNISENSARQTFFYSEWSFYICSITYMHSLWTNYMEESIPY